MQAKILKAGTVVNVKGCSGDDLLQDYGGIFKRNEKGQIVTKVDGVVKVENGKPFFLDTKEGNWKPIEIKNNTKKETEEEEEEEEYEDEEEEEEIEESPISQSNSYKTNPFVNAGQGAQTFYYFRKNPEPTTTRYPRGNITNVKGNTLPYNNSNRNPLDFSSNPMNHSMLGGKFDEFVNAVNSSKALSIKNGIVTGDGQFKNKYLDKIKNCKLLFYASPMDKKDERSALNPRSDYKYITTGPESPMYLNKAQDRARLLNNIDSVIDYLNDDKIINRACGTVNILKKAKPLSITRCIRYTSYATIGNVLRECAKMTYNDIGTDKAEQTLGRVEGLMKALSLSNEELTFEDGNEHGGNKKDSFLTALSIWKTRYNELLQLKNIGGSQGLQDYVIRNERADLSLNNTNNLNRGPFTGF